MGAVGFFIICFPPLGAVALAREIITPPDKTFGQSADRKTVGVYRRFSHNVVGIKFFAKALALFITPG